MFKPSRDTSHKPTPSSSVTATNNINLIMSHTPLLSDCGSTGSTLDLTLDGVSTHDGVTTLEEDEANVRSKAETSSVVCSLPIFIRPFRPSMTLGYAGQSGTIALTVLMTLYWSKFIT
jgi:hypothetical protein